MKAAKVNEILLMYYMPANMLYHHNCFVQLEHLLVSYDQHWARKPKNIASLHECINEIFCKMNNQIVDLHKELNEKIDEKSKYNIPPQLKTISFKQSAKIWLNFDKKYEKNDKKYLDTINDGITTNINMKDKKLELDTIKSQFQQEWKAKAVNCVKPNSYLQLEIEIVGHFD